MSLMCRLARNLIWRLRRERARVGPVPGISEWLANGPIAVPEPPSATYPLDLDIGEVADGYHLIVRSISLTGEHLLFDYAFVPGLTEEARTEIWPNMNYGADVSPPGWNLACSEAEVYERPVPGASYAWFDFFRADYEFAGVSDGDYLRNRISRMTFDLRTGEARIQK